MAIMDTPKELNGYPVIRVEQHTDCATVMVDKPGEYVVATWWPELKTCWMWGHYFPVREVGDDRIAFKDAMETFNECATRNGKRF